MAMLKPTTARRREVRRTVGRPGARWLQQFLDRHFALAALHIVLLTILGSGIAWTARQRLPYRVGQSITAPYVARSSFVSVNAEKTKENKQRASERQPTVYKPNTTFFDDIRKHFDGIIALAADENIQGIDQISSEQQKTLHLDDAALGALRSFIADGKANQGWIDLVEGLLSNLAGIVVLEDRLANFERDESKAFGIIIRHPEGEMQRLHGAILSLSEAEQPLNNTVSRSLIEGFPKSLRKTVVAIVMQNVSYTYVMDDVETQRRRDQKANAVPVVTRRFEPNSVLVGPGPVQHFEKEHIQLIVEERAAYRKQIRASGRLAQDIGTFGVISILAFILWTYIATYYPQIISNPLRGISINGLLVLCLALAIALTTTVTSALGGEQLWHIAPQFLYAGGVFPTLVTVIVLTIAYDQRFALAVGVVHTIFVAFILNLPLGFVLVLLAGVCCTVSQLHEIRSRSKLVRVGLWSGLMMAVAVLLTGTFGRPLHIPGEGWRIGRDALLALATAFATGLFVQGILPAIERIFQVATSMTLKELNDASHPLLRRLAQMAPGTYQHSLRIAEMAEAAAEAIGANTLLCRAAAMYHDIGKTNKPAYFVENQASGQNRHSKLSPAMSVLIIVGHVKDGTEMAREYRLPQSVRHIIESHQGTTLVEYFYHAAKKQGEANGKDSGVSEFEFRYPGPKPQTKEACIVMICDTIEGAARTLAEPTPARLENLVHKLAMKRLMDGQFDQCNLTLQELHQIEDSVTKTLCTTYHGRVAYPSDQQQEAPQAGEGERRADSVAS